MDGSTLTAANGSWAGSTPLTFAYQWRRCNAAGGSCANIGGATGSTYSLAAADVGSTLRVVVTASNGGGSVSATAAQTPVVQAAAPANTALPLDLGDGGGRADAERLGRELVRHRAADVRLPVAALQRGGRLVR